jgi:hypothetical protein
LAISAAPPNSPRTSFTGDSSAIPKTLVTAVTSTPLQACYCTNAPGEIPALARRQARETRLKKIKKYFF